MFTITIDNATNNDAMIKFLKIRLKAKPYSILGCEFLHVRCAAHILKGNLALPSHELPLSPFAPMRYQVYIRAPMNCHFVTNNPLPLVKDVKYDGQRVTCALLVFSPHFALT